MGIQVNKTPDDIVYVYNFENLIIITRTREGIWHYNYKISTVHKRFEKSFNKKISTQIASDMFDLGREFGLLVAELLEECEKSY